MFHFYKKSIRSIQDIYHQLRLNAPDLSTQKGFTLIELLVVMMIIALIGSIAFPNFSSIQTKAKESNVKSLAHSLQLGIESYFVSQGSYPEGDGIALPALVSKLSTAGVFGQTPKNPFTGTTYTDKDASGKMVYTYDSKTQIYTLSVYSTGNSEIILTLQNN